MKKLSLPIILILLSLFAGCAKNAATVQYGIYPVKVKTLTFFDLIAKDFVLSGQAAELTDSKPENLTVDSEIKLDNPRYGAFTFGNNNCKVWFMMSQDNQGFWTEFYIDQNLDNRITPKEKIKGFQTGNGKEKQFNIRESGGLIPAPIRVSYKGETGEYVKKLFFFLTVREIEERSEKESAKELLVWAFDASFLEGEVSVRVGKKQQNCRFRIYDANGNGCFNDFGKDLFYLDLNNDGYFKKDESFKLVEFMDRSENNRKTQYRFVVLPFPSKVAFLNALEEYNRSEFEPVSDPPDKNQANPSEKPASKTETETPKAGAIP